MHKTNIQTVGRRQENGKEGPGERANLAKPDLEHRPREDSYSIFGRRWDPQFGYLFCVFGKFYIWKILEFKN